MQKLTIDSLLSWEDFINLGIPTINENTCFSEKFFKRTSKIKAKSDQVVEDINKEVEKIIKNRFPDIPYSKEMFDCVFYIAKDESSNKWVVKIWSDNFLKNLLILINKEKKGLEGIPQYNEENRLEGLKKYKLKIRELLSTSITESQRNEYIYVRKAINWTINNYEEFFSFLKNPIPLDIFKEINKDKFMLNMAASALKSLETKNSQGLDTYSFNYRYSSAKFEHKKN